MKNLVETIARALVDYPDSVRVEEQQQENTLVLTLSVDENDMGKVIGKQGRIAHAIRSVLYASATHQNKRVRLDIVE
ncbi:RNA-binding protein (KH domain) [Alteribacillus persepolensis]|uniref:RNA-binding protein KhpA n=1 Tax=Alteribacillus persepolensis TaxID=568899 RepID=A0A1G7YLA2_9BACI|nr:KH domain-containing protein [Alteribacillus persepolensis]SDG97019.1 RNA-binding protein (KH domain) [Alteribacillus persepolensis]